MIYITHIRLNPPTSSRHEHITHVAWDEYGSSKTGVLTRQEAVDWIRGGGEARVHGNPYDVKVLVVEAQPPYIRTAANGTYTDNLLSLPRF